MSLELSCNGLQSHHVPLMNVNYFYRSTTIIIPVLLPHLRIVPMRVLERQRKQKEPVGRLAFSLPRNHFI
jgi:hypothetical protein